jgi:cytochrome c oxidase cbb3-type subunit I/II
MRIIPLYWIRALGGSLFLAGFLVMCFNLWKTVKLAPRDAKEEVFTARRLTAIPKAQLGGTWHRRLEGLAPTFSILTLIAILVGSIIEILPTMIMHTYVDSNNKAVPYSALELAGRDLYVSEGCYTCHSQMIRQLPYEVLRYGPASTPEESMYDRPFQWGSKRTGPDLARVGGKYPNMWHYRHMLDPRSVTPNSIMPAYPWLIEKKIDFLGLQRKLEVMRSLGVLYGDGEMTYAASTARIQAAQIAADLGTETGIKNLEERQIVALLAYLQRLGKNTSTAAATKVGNSQ